MRSSALNKVIEDFDHLELADKEYAVEVVKKQLIEAKRDAIAKKAKKVFSNHKKGITKKGNLKELYKDLESD